jgi:hypothetical protein
VASYYKEIQTIKHALQLSIKSKQGTEKEIDIPYEQELLNYYTEKAEYLKNKYRIK